MPTASEYGIVGLALAIVAWVAVEIVKIVRQPQKDDANQQILINNTEAMTELRKVVEQQGALLQKQGEALQRQTELLLELKFGRGARN
jgi:hypothetical protein